MKVKYVKYRRMPTSSVLNPVYFSDEDKDPRLTLGKVYHVVLLSLPNRTQEEGELILRSGRDNSPGVFKLNDFEIVDYTIPSNWILDMSHPNWVRLHPRELDLDFWDRFHDGNDAEVEAAEALFEQVYQRMTQS
jgi:hypothetical protein